MKHLLLALTLVTCGAHATLKSQPIEHYEITDEDCDALKEISRAAVLYRNEDVPLEVVKGKINADNNNPALKALVPHMLLLADIAYNNKTTTPEVESENTYMKCMDHIYAGTDF